MVIINNNNFCMPLKFLFLRLEKLKAKAYKIKWTFA
jgi:hypothetical protein